MADLTVKLSTVLLGATTGVLVGLSNSPTAATVISALLSSAIFLPNFLQHDDSYSRRERAYGQLPYFVLPFVLCLFGGVHLKNYTPLFPSQVSTDFANLLEIEVDPDVAREAIVTRYSGAKLETSGGLPAQSLKIDENLLRALSGEVADLYGVLHLARTSEANLSSSEANQIEVISGQLLLNFRAILAREISDEAALIWYELARMPLDQRAAYVSDKEATSPAAMQAIVEYFQ